MSRAKRVGNTRLQNWAKALIEDEVCMQEVRNRFQLRMLSRFRASTHEVRDEINHIMDNEQAFFEELTAICDEILDVNDGADDSVN
jgi:hypothetical protein